MIARMQLPRALEAACGTISASPPWPWWARASRPPRCAASGPCSPTIRGALWNAARLAKSLALDGKTVARYLDLMVDLLLVRRLPPFLAKTRKRLVKSPKVYIRDSGLVQRALAFGRLAFGRPGGVYGHPVAGPSWEGFAIESLLQAAPPRTEASFYRTATGVEADLVLELPGRQRWLVEIKLGRATPERALHVAVEDVQPVSPPRPGPRQRRPLPPRQRHRGHRSARAGRRNCRALALTGRAALPTMRGFQTGRRVGRRQVVRHRVLIPAFAGSNPAAPASSAALGAGSRRRFLAAGFSQVRELASHDR